MLAFHANPNHQGGRPVDSDASAVPDAEPAIEVDGPVQNELQALYAQLQEDALGVYHNVVVIVAPGGPLEAGQPFTLKPFEAQPMTLTKALARIGEYLASPAAVARGDLYRDLDTARDEQKQAMEGWNAASRKVRAMESAVRRDLDNALLDGELDEPEEEEASDGDQA